LAEGEYQIEGLAKCYYPEGIFVTPNKNESVLDATKRLQIISCLFAGSFNFSIITSSPLLPPFYKGQRH